MKNENEIDFEIFIHNLKEFPIIQKVIPLW